MPLLEEEREREGRVELRDVVMRGDRSGDRQNIFFVL